MGTTVSSRGEHGDVDRLEIYSISRGLGKFPCPGIGRVIFLEKTVTWK